MTHQFREDGRHFNGGKEWFGYGYSAIGEPRLSMVRKWQRTGRERGRVTDSFSVDGRPVASYAAALEALKTPPVLTDDERPFLALFGGEPAPRPSGDVSIIFGLRAKGFVESADRLWRLTEAGLSALQKKGGDQC